MMVAGSRRGKRESVVPRREGLWRCGGALCPLDSLARRLSGQITSGLDGTRESGTVQSLPFQARPSASAEGGGPPKRAAARVSSSLARGGGSRDLQVIWTLFAAPNRISSAL